MNNLIDLFITSNPANRSAVLDLLDVDPPAGESNHSVPHATRPVKVLIAEDQPEHAEWLRECLRRLRPQWYITDVVSSTSSLASAIEEHAPDLLLLDVRIEGGSTLEVVETLSVDIPIIFISAAVECAITAFDLSAKDFIPKPLRAARLEKALIRFSESRVVIPTGRSTPGDAKWLTAYRDKLQIVLHYDEIMYLQSQGKYTRVVTANGDAHIRKGLGHLEKSLDNKMFYRVHRGVLININRARNLSRDDFGRLMIQFEGKSDWIQVGKSYERLFRDF